jgi:sulfopyruvate decarboxylase alpha subunit
VATDSAATAWHTEVFQQFKRVNIRQVGYVPDAGHAALIRLCQDDPEIADIVLTTEEEGVGLVSGAALGGQRAVLLMQSSGVGNCINLFSLVKTCRFPCVILVTMRGEYGEFNPWQIPMSSITEVCFQASGFTVYRAEEEAQVADLVGAGLDMAFAGDVPIAILLSQRLIGRKKWVKTP